MIPSGEQMSSFGIPFQVFTLILLPTLLFLGAATFGRVLESSIEDYFYQPYPPLLCGDRVRDKWILRPVAV